MQGQIGQGFKPKVRPERSYWRDLRLNDLHRKWGLDCPVTDLDWLVCEYDQLKPVSIVEYKHERAAPQKKSDYNTQVITELANGYREGLPAFAVRYANDFSWWLAVPLNDPARILVPDRTRISMLEWVTILYDIRGRPLPDDVMEFIKSNDKITQGLSSHHR